MKKVPTIFQRNPESNKKMPNVPHPDCDWIFKGKGIATLKYDGTCCLVKDGKLYKRREVKGDKPVPQNFIPADADQVTGKRVGWVPCDPDSCEDQWHREAFKGNESDGTYELVGPRVQGNPEKFERHTLLKHSEAQSFPDVPRDYEGLREWLRGRNMEGLVFRHPDGRMAKIKKRDFGMARDE